MVLSSSPQSVAGLCGWRRDRFAIIQDEVCAVRAARYLHSIRQARHAIYYLFLNLGACTFMSRIKSYTRAQGCVAAIRGRGAAKCQIG